MFIFNNFPHGKIERNNIMKLTEKGSAVFLCQNDETSFDAYAFFQASVWKVKRTVSE